MSATWREGDPVAYIMSGRDALYEFADGIIRRSNGRSLTRDERAQLLDLPRVPLAPAALNEDKAITVTVGGYSGSLLADGRMHAELLALDLLQIGYVVKIDGVTQMITDRNSDPQQLGPQR